MQKRKKALIITLMIVTIIITILITFAVIYFTTDIFKNGQQAFIYAISKNMETFATLANTNTNIQEEFRKNYSYSSTGTINGNINQENVNQNVTLKTTARRDKNSGRYYADITLQNASQDILKYSYINDNDIYAIKCDDILPNYIGVRNSNLKEYAKNMGISEETVSNIPDQIDFEVFKGAFNVTKEEKEHLSSIYTNTISNSISKENFQKNGKENITVNNISCNASKYTLKLNGEEIKTLLINLLNTAKTDEISINILAKLQNALTTNVDTTQINSNIENTIAKIQNDEIIANTTFVMELYYYKGDTIKTVIDISNIGKVTINTDKNTQNIVFLIEKYDDIGNINMTSQITISKGNYNDNVVYNLEIIPDTLNINQNINIMAQFGNTTESGYTNSYEVAIQNSEKSSMNFQYNVETLASENVEEIQEITDSNSIIFNNYKIEQLVPFITAYMQQNSALINNKLLSIDNTTVN